MNSALFRQKVAQAPDNLLFRFSLGQALFQEDSPEEALEHLECCCRGRADWMLPRIILGKALIALGRKAEAKAPLEEALQLAIEQHHEDPEDELRTLLADL